MEQLIKQITEQIQAGQLALADASDLMNELKGLINE